MDPTIEANLRQQAELYGRPLGEIVREVTTALGTSQAHVAEVLGMSAPMLSQLSSGRRVKIGNPQAVSRLQALVELAPHAARMSPADREAALASIAASATTITSAPTSGLPAQLRALAGPDALLAAAAAAAPLSPALATLLRQAAEVPHG